MNSYNEEKQLIQDIAKNSYGAAFGDPELLPLTTEEYSRISKHVSIPSKPDPIIFTDEKDLLRQICPNIDSLIISDMGNRETFSPTVWDSLPDPKLFLQQLKLKAGLPIDLWSKTIQVKRYTVEIVE